MRRSGSLFKTKIAPLQTQTLIETKKSHIKMLKMALLNDCAINEKCYSVDGGRGIFPLFSSLPRGIWQLKSPRLWEFVIQGKKNAYLWLFRYYTFADTLQGKSEALQPSWIVFVTVLFISICTIFIYNDVCFSIIIPPWSLEWFQAKYKRISLPSLFKVIVIFFI